MKEIRIEPLTRQAFAPYGDVLELPGDERITINRGRCIRHHALSMVEIDGGGQAALSIFEGTPYDLPHTLDLVERHPLGSQAFFPMQQEEWLVIVCEDDDGKPSKPRAFLATGRQGINLKRNQWHGVLTPLSSPANFFVVDRVGQGANLQEFDFKKPYRVVRSS